MSKTVEVRHGPHVFQIEVTQSSRARRTAPDPLSDLVIKGALPRPNIAEVVKDVTELQSTISSFCGAIFETFEAMPDVAEATVEFGLKLVGEAAIPTIAKATGEGALKITVKWSRKKPGDSMQDRA